MCIAFALLPCWLQGQLPMTMQQCEDLLMQNSALLQAARYRVEAARGQVRQAGLRPNPYAEVNLNALNPEGGRAFDVGRNGQKTAGLEQLLQLGGKRQRAIELARAGEGYAALEYEELARQLRKTLRSSYHSLYFDQSLLGTLDQQLELLQTLVDAYRQQADAGNVPMSDLVRLQSLQLQLRNERTQLFNGIVEEQALIGLLTGIPKPVVPNPDTLEARWYDTRADLDSAFLLQAALEHRTDLRLARQQVEVAERNLALQRALAAPDLALGLSYDQRGNAFRNEVTLSAAIPLMLWNKNQGNIQSADAEIRTARAMLDQQQAEVETAVYAAHRRYRAIQQQYDEVFDARWFDGAAVIQAVYDNFQRRNITLLAFTDFVESHYQTVNQLNQIRKQRALIYEELLFLTAYTLK